jgi:O-antigen ligase/polysaccharide polymerase Wzy-like membrane protein
MLDAAKPGFAARRLAEVTPFAAALALGLAAAISPVTIAVAFATGCAAFLVLRLGRRSARAFLAMLALLLAGYAFLDRGFAHVGASPVYLGEIILTLGLLAVAASGRPEGLLRVRPRAAWLVVPFMTWGLARTLPYIQQYGIDALRDAVLWAYAAFALLVAGTLERSTAERVVPLYRRLVPFFLLWLPIGAILTQIGAAPSLSEGSVPIVNLKLGDAGVHLAGVGAFALLGLHGRWRPASTVIQTVAFVLSAGIVASINRGGFLAASTAALALTRARPSRAWPVVALTAALVVGSAVVVDPLADVQFSGDRSASIAQINLNLSSIFGDTRISGLEGTETFRLEWWSAIVDYTIFGPHFWTGKGFGVNLGIDDGFQTSADDPARAPHNSHLAILARMGVPGLLLWVGLLLAFGGSLFASFVRAQRARQERRTRVIAWVAIYWLAMLVNMSVDPYLEGPMGGIWFWSVMGFGFAVASNDDLFSSSMPGRGEQAPGIGQQPQRGA